MSAFTVALILLSQVLLVASQIIIKHAVNRTHESPKPWPRIIAGFAASIAGMTVCFFLWIGFLQKLDLSRVFPFEGLSPIILVLGASFFLGEKVGPRAWLGIALIAAGIALVWLS